MRQNAKRSSKKTRKQVRMTGLMERRLKDYSLAAAGVGALAFASPASASIATTTLSVAVPARTYYGVTLAGQHVLSISNTVSSVEGSVKIAHVFASAGVLFAVNGGGLRISPVAAGQSVPGALARASSTRTLVSTSRSFGGPVKNHWNGFLGSTEYLGFSFGSGPTLHYGWLQLNISQNSNHSYSVTLVQAAYEQCAGQSITAGTTSGGASCAAAPPPTIPAPNSLWLLALGVAGLAGLETMRRFRKTA